jgi:hypothetical protein
VHPGYPLLAAALAATALITTIVVAAEDQTLYPLVAHALDLLPGRPSFVI